MSNIKKKILFVINNLSGTVSQYNIPKCIEMFLDTDIYDYSTYFIDHGMNEELYHETLNLQHDIIVTVGGDGTLLELGQKIINRDIVLGIIPIGSGNGLATHIGYKPRDVKGAFDAINQGKVSAIDVANMNETDYFFSNFGMGIDAKIAKDFKLKKNRSFFVYSYLTFKRIFSIKSKNIKFNADGVDYEVQTYLFNIFNSNLFGYNVGLIPWASATDGLLDIAYVRAVSMLRMPWVAFCILIKKPNWTSVIQYMTASEVTIYNFKTKKMGYQIDGDPKKSKREDLRIKVLPGKLKMIVP
jgi:diacylglycerol kinase (ATP)